MVGDFGAGGVAREVELLGEVGVPGEGGEWGGGVGWWTRGEWGVLDGRVGRGGGMGEGRWKGWELEQGKEGWVWGIGK